jgi:hypothetical protein
VSDAFTDIFGLVRGFNRAAISPPIIMQTEPTGIDWLDYARGTMPAGSSTLVQCSAEVVQKTYCVVQLALALAKNNENVLVASDKLTHEQMRQLNQAGALFIGANPVAAMVEMSTEEYTIVLLDVQLTEENFIAVLPDIAHVAAKYKTHVFSFTQIAKGHSPTFVHWDVKRTACDVVLKLQMHPNSEGTYFLIVNRNRVYPQKAEIKQRVVLLSFKDNRFISQRFPA